MEVKALRKIKPQKAEMKRKSKRHDRKFAEEKEEKIRGGEKITGGIT